ncbi:MAG: hypothetical protein K8W52_12355 [Deltaproteobacteria bacterium]|nr:hypothetical protein [Deltaproteobacteria bacterium]
MQPVSRPAGCDHLDDELLVARFEALAIPPSDFRHREHVRLAFAMLAGADFGEAAVRYRHALRRFAASVGAAGKYHETLTWAYLAVIHARMDALGCATSFELCARAPELLDPRGALARHYDLDAIARNPVARRVFVLPDR